jgi:hypothetical protein
MLKLEALDTPQITQPDARTLYCPEEVMCRLLMKLATKPLDNK